MQNIWVTVVGECVIVCERDNERTHMASVIRVKGRGVPTKTAAEGRGTICLRIIVFRCSCFFTRALLPHMLITDPCALQLLHCEVQTKTAQHKIFNFAQGWSLVSHHTTVFVLEV